MENREIFDMYDKMFEMGAWKDLVEDLSNRQKGLSSYLINNPQATDKDLYRAQGLNTAYSYIIGLEASMDAAKKQSAEDLPEVRTNE